MSIPEVIPVFREMVHLRSHIDAWNRGVRVGKRRFPKGKLGCFCLEEQEGEMDGGQGRHKQHCSPELPSPVPYLHPVLMPRGAGALPTSFQPRQGGTRREDLIPLTHSSQGSAFLPGSLLTHNLCLCLHRNFSLLIYMETPER